MAIKDTDIELIVGGANNNMDVEVYAGVFISKVITKIDMELTISGLYKVNTIVIKKICKSNLF